jgi:hypothetical protein
MAGGRLTAGVTGAVVCAESDVAIDASPTTEIMRFMFIAEEGPG